MAFFRIEEGQSGELDDEVVDTVERMEGVSTNGSEMEEGTRGGPFRLEGIGDGLSNEDGDGDRHNVGERSSELEDNDGEGDLRR